MDTFTVLLGVLEQSLKLWNTKEGRKYLDQFIALKKEYNEELDKRAARKRYSQLKLDRIVRDINLIGEAFIKFGPKSE